MEESLRDSEVENHDWRERVWRKNPQWLLGQNRGRKGGKGERRVEGFAWGKKQRQVFRGGREAREFSGGGLKAQRNWSKGLKKGGSSGKLS